MVQKVIFFNFIYTFWYIREKSYIAERTKMFSGLARATLSSMRVYTITPAFVICGKRFLQYQKEYVAWRLIAGMLICAVMRQNFLLKRRRQQCRTRYMINELITRRAMLMMWIVLTSEEAFYNCIK